MILFLLISILIVLLVTMGSSIIGTVVIVKSKKDGKSIAIKTLKILAIVYIVIIAVLISVGVSYKVKEQPVISEETVTLEEAGFKNISVKEFNKILNSKKKSIVLVARPTCMYCEKFAPVLKEAKDKMNLKINYIDTDEFGEDDWYEFTSSLEFLQGEWGTPLLMIVQDGKLVDKNNGYVEYHDLEKFLNRNGFGD